jgi:biotin transport system substrate-specific component|tara:strand:- start:29 stop:655 length:627 start_codon:yes stop_codon:yes gene_type:complete
MELIKQNTQSQIIKSLFVIFLGSIILTISAKIKVPFYPVPMTMQTFVVVLIGVTLGWKLGLATVFAYLFEGAIGIPVFAGTPEKGLGVAYLMGPTGGYLFGFLVATYVAGSFKYDNCFDSQKFKLAKENLPFFLALRSAITLPYKNIIKLIFSVSFIYIFGLLWLGFLIGWDKPIFQLGAYPFLLAELFKILILAYIAGFFYKVKKII